MIQALSLTPYFQVLESHREYFYWKALIYTATGYALYVKDETNTHTHTHTHTHTKPITHPFFLVEQFIEHSSCESHYARNLESTD